MEQTREIEAASFACWPALQEMEIDGWLLRFGGGHTKRANSANPLRGGAVDPEALIPRIEAQYRRQQLPPVFRLTPLGDMSGYDVILAARGYRLVEPSRILVLPDLAELPRPGVPDGLQLRLDGRPDSAWLAANDELRPIAPAERTARDAILRAIAVPAAFAALYDRGMPLAVALGAVSGGWFYLNAVATRQSARGRGLMRALVGEMAEWAR